MTELYQFSQTVASSCIPISSSVGHLDLEFYSKIQFCMIKKWSLSWFPNNLVGLTSLVQFSKQWTLLTLEQRPIAYHGQELKGKALHLSTYETKLLSLVNVVESGGLIH